MKKRIFLIVLDSVGIGELPDASFYHDEGSNTLVNTARYVGGLKLPNLEKLGLGNIADILGIAKIGAPLASYGKMTERSKGKDTTTGHWEIAGVTLKEAFPTYPNGFPDDLIKEFEQRVGRKVIGNKVASGTKIIEELGDEMVKTGSLIVYTSADSVFQIAAHEEVVPLSELYHICEIARELLTEEHAVGRVIARPFLGESGSYYRTPNRHDYSRKPSGETILDVVSRSKRRVLGIGKIGDIFAWTGIEESIRIKDNQDGMEQLLKIIKENDEEMFLFANFNDFDTLYGHRNLPEGYAKALEEFDKYLGLYLAELKDEDLLIITADHGCDPTITTSTDHSREYVPVLVYDPAKKEGHPLGVRKTYSDIAATIAETWNLDITCAATSLLSDNRG